MRVKLLNRYFTVSALLCLGAEGVLLGASVFAAYRIRFFADPGGAYFDDHLWIRAAVFGATVLVAMYFHALYDFEHHWTLRATFIALLRSFAVAVPVLLALYYVTFPALTLGRGVFVLALPIGAAAVFGWRLLLRHIVGAGLFSERILIVGAGDAAKRLAEEVLSQEHLGYTVVGFVDDDSSLWGTSLVNPTVLGATSQLVDLAREHQVGKVVVAQRDYRNRLDIDSLLKCKTAGIEVIREPDYYQTLTGRIMLDGLRKSWLVFSPGFKVSFWVQLEKRIVDLVVASLGLLIALPLMAITAAAVVADSRGGAFYRQTRVGRNGATFSLWKFRSMVKDSESRGGPQFASKNDARITRVGRFLRRSRLDELPQLWNIVKGEMSLVGPRPERPEFVEELAALSPYYKERLAVRPGLTGWAQINAPYAASLEDSLDKLSYDLYYIKNQSIFLDISIILSTLRAVLTARGSR